ncbi:P-loop containing nucleoside triphosphate hydrolase protein [Coccomyxa subellipsoidea C-169]|uniref:RNA helicase n=1 Tax=Coccomyxa subellipsoidea (strain C-169) TaxID=574566 RepID=I0Z4L4_COCSC|nr:P-loop containing nucleoside triphosphate hydrolase protein [Coccomyxa subellipsoidea C-169]EIE25583.1 P-loop containing nucleoside triphosphate hydrolase protein [Coccomyxa subellipsoidea C-169]|eukprot:XP_005650127.1 P-loop containing nucleoside triphosphate hydrolase protein [Coccomyxa subellipsoidea C-169]
MRSKRERKQKGNATKTLKRKATAVEGSQSLDVDNTDAEQDARLGSTPDDSNAVFLMPKPKKEDTGAAEDAAVARELSKAQKRKLKKVQEEKEKRVERRKVLASLAEHELPSEHLALMQSTARRGQRITKRQKLKNALAYQRLGLEAPSDSLLLVERPEADDAETSDEDGDDAPRARTMTVPNAKTKARGAEGLRRPLSPSDEDSEEAVEDGETDAGAAPAGMSLEEQRSAAQAIRQELGLAEDAAATEERRGSHAHAGPAPFVRVVRSQAMQDARSGLPILGMEQEIMEAVAENDVILLCGETGSGKTTQVPQFLYEAGYGSSQFLDRAGRIGVTQPRRVAAIAAAQRVAQELSTPIGATVGYQVRYDKKVGPGTAVKFMTDGILMRELQADFLLRDYSVLVLDEAHERSLNTDLLLGLLSRMLPLRNKLAAEKPDILPLKLIIMSATLRVEDFAANSDLFKTPPPIVRVPARQYPVTIHFARRTELHDYVGNAFGKVCQIHERLPPGGILVFLTGQREVEYLCRRLRSKYDPKHSAAQPAGRHDAGPGTDARQAADAFGADEAEEQGDVDFEGRDAVHDDFEMEEALEDEEDVVIMGGDGFTPEQIAAAEARLNAQLGTKLGALKGAEESDGPGKVHVLPLYAMLPRSAQAAVFGAVPEGARLIVVATNVAETSLTIPGVRYVVDAGRAKEKVMDSHGAASKYEVSWISKASAEQRTGRAGRTGPGHSYRLYSSAHFHDNFPQHGDPEVLRTPLEGVALVMKAMGIDKVTNFPFPTPPDRAALAAAQTCLQALGALDSQGALTDLGKAMAVLPLNPRPSRMILQASTSPVAKETSASKKRSGGALTYAVALAAIISVESPFVHIDGIAAQEGESEDSMKRRRQSAKSAHNRLRVARSDVLSALAAFCAYVNAPDREGFCRDTYLHSRNLREACALHRQLVHLLQQMGDKIGAFCAGTAMQDLLRSADTLDKPSPTVLMQLQRAIAAGWADQISRRVHSIEYVQEHSTSNKGRGRAVRYTPNALDEQVFMHPQSAMAKAAPEFVAYTQIVRTEKRPYMTGVTEVEAGWLSTVAEPLVQLSAPQDDPAPHYSRAADAVVATHAITFGRHGWPLPSVEKPLLDKTLQARFFAAALLAGRVLPALEELRDVLAASPAKAAAAESQGERRVGELVGALARRQVCSRRQLAAQWSEDADFLRPELGAWLRKGQTGRLDNIWARLHEEVLQERNK